jgi:hypothetical protein
VDRVLHRSMIDALHKRNPIRNAKVTYEGMHATRYRYGLGLVRKEPQCEYDSSDRFG